MEWSREKTFYLIELYKEKRALWDPSDMSYKNRQVKHESWAELGLAMAIDPHEVEKKMRMLVGQFFRELKRGKSGDGVYAEYKSKWLFFTALLFLKDRKEPLNSRDVSPNEFDLESGLSSEFHLKGVVEAENVIEEQKYSKTMGNLKMSHLASTSSYCMKRKADSQNDGTTYSSKKTIPHQGRDEFDVFGEHVAYSLRNLMSKSCQSFAKFQIANILYQAEVGYHNND